MIRTPTARALRGLAVAAVALAPLTPLAGPASAANAAPRMVSARMADGDRDDHADRVILTYSEAVNHSRDTDGHYPFAVSGYRVTAVGVASRSRTLVLYLKERSTRDIGTHPGVGYTRTTRQPVRDTGGKQAIGQAIGTTPLDADHDGYARTDCGPTKASIHPGAVDLPDLQYVDSNCDGIDGRRTGPVFVSPSGDDANPGTIGRPKKTLVSALAGSPAAIYLARGTYAWTGTAALGTSVYGGYAGSGWSRSGSNISLISAPAGIRWNRSATLQLVRFGRSGGGTAGVRTLDLTDGHFLLDHVRVTAGPAADAQKGAVLNTAAVFAHGATLVVQGGVYTAGQAGNGRAGVRGAAGQPGGDGATAPAATCNADPAPSPSGGLSAAVPGAVGLDGGAGGAGGLPHHDGADGGDTISPVYGGKGGAQASFPGPAGDGDDGSPGINGTPGARGSTGRGIFGSTGYRPGIGDSGTTGAPGSGGSGGGGGGGYADGTGSGDADKTGASGSGGGGGGAGGRGGTPGSGGGASVGIYLVNTGTTLSGVTVVTGGGGNGGAGGLGGTGGTGGLGGAHKIGCATFSGGGGAGGNGGSGGTGGPGAAGSGGDSYGVLAFQSPLTLSSPVWQIGPGGTSPAGTSYAGDSDTLLTVS